MDTEFEDRMQTYLGNQLQVQGREPDETLVTIMEACGDMGVNKPLKLVLKACSTSESSLEFLKNAGARAPSPSNSG